MDKKNASTISNTKQKIMALSKGINRQLEIIAKAKEITKGTIYNQKKKCGHKNCKCAAGQLHQTRVLSFNEHGKTRLIPLTKYSINELYKIEWQVKEYQRFRKSRAEIVQHFNHLITEINKLENNLRVEVTPNKKGKNTYERKRNKREIRRSKKRTT